jgi:broad specificity phosphatase PhoE
MLREVWLIRHAEAYNTAEDDAQRSILDPLNPPLTPLGEQQAEEVAALLEMVRPRQIRVSPFLRTVQTVLPYLEITGEKAVIDFRIGEIFARQYFQEFTGLRPESYPPRIARRLLSLQGLELRSNFPDFPETQEQVEARTLAAWQDYQTMAFERLVVVGHGASLRGLAGNILGKPDPTIGHSHGGASQFLKINRHWRAEYINQTSHLTQTGEPAI